MRPTATDRTCSACALESTFKPVSAAGSNAWDGYIRTVWRTSHTTIAGLDREGIVALASRQSPERSVVDPSVDRTIGPAHLLSVGGAYEHLRRATTSAGTTPARR